MTKRLRGMFSEMKWIRAWPINQNIAWLAIVKPHIHDKNILRPTGKNRPTDKTDTEEENGRGNTGCQ